MNPSTALPPAFSPNLSAFLQTITWSELGPRVIAESDEGFNVLVGSAPGNVFTFSSYRSHPGLLVSVRDAAGAVRVQSTAAGAFQILERTFDAYRQSLSLPDFSKLSQRLIAVQLLRECRALPDIEAGNFSLAITRSAARWASLPGSPYNQHTNPLPDLESFYRSKGGT